MSPTTAPQDLRDLIQEGSQRLTRAGIPEARREAEWCALHLWGGTRADLYRLEPIPTDRTRQKRFRSLIHRRSQREPLQHILGSQPFWDLDFEVSPAVLIPRPETELLIEGALDRFPDRANVSEIADIGTGSGCLAVTLAKAFPNARVWATDLSPSALKMARRNASAHGVLDRTVLFHGNLLQPLFDRGLEGRLDLIVANPPYIPTSELEHLQDEVRLFEPRMALDGGADGLDYYPDILNQAYRMLRPGGALFLEVGIRQSDIVVRKAGETGFLIDRVARDLAGIERAVLLNRPNGRDGG